MPRAEIVEAAREISRRGLVPGTSGNISVRGGAGVLITPARRPYGTLTPDDVAEVCFDGRIVAAPHPPSSELPLHIGIYHVRPDVGAVVHTHSAYATACGVAGEPLVDTEERRYYALGDVPTVPYAPSGSLALARWCARAAVQADVMLLERHGVVALGPTLEAALNRAVAVEHVAQVTLLAAAARRSTTLPSIDFAFNDVHDQERRCRQMT